MSYELIFWRQEHETNLEPLAIYQSLNDGEHVPSLATLPVDDMLRALQTSFSAAVLEPNGDQEWLIWASRDRNKPGSRPTWSRSALDARFTISHGRRAF